MIDNIYYHNQENRRVGCALKDDHKNLKVADLNFPSLLKFDKDGHCESVKAKEANEIDFKDLPLGLTPKVVSQTVRLKEICEALVRYHNANIKIPIEWIQEYNELVGAGVELEVK